MSRLVLRDAQDLFGALRSDSIKRRMAVLSAVTANPGGALSLGRMYDWDVIDELVHQSYQSCSIPYYRALMRALAAYDDERVLALFVKVEGMARDEEILETVRGWLAARQASSEPTPAE